MNEPTHGQLERPGRVAAIRGLVFQADAESGFGDAIIRPFEALDRWAAGLRPGAGPEPLANHVGIHLVMEDGREIVAEQLVGAPRAYLRDGLNWTPIDRFRDRDRGGWDVTVPATAFRGVDAAAVAETVARLNAIEGHPFLGEDCTQFVERAFGGRRLFADSPLLRRLGIGLRIGDPTLPLLRADARLAPRAERLLRAEVVGALEDPLADYSAPNGRLWLRRLAPAIVALVVGVLLVTRFRSLPRLAPGR